MIEREELRGHLDSSKLLTSIALAMLTKIDKVLLDVCRHYRETNNSDFNEYDLIHQVKCCALFAYIEFCNSMIDEIKASFEDYATLLSVENELKNLVNFKDNHKDYDKLCYYYALSNPEQSFEVMYQYWYESVGKDRLFSVSNLCKEAVNINVNITTISVLELYSFQVRYDKFISEIKERLNHIE